MRQVTQRLIYLGSPQESLITTSYTPRASLHPRLIPYLSLALEAADMLTQTEKVCLNN